MTRDWSREFDEPIPLPKGRQLVTLRDAGDYIIKLPEAEHAAPEWQAAMEALILVATLGGPTMFARVFDPSAKDGYWGKGKVKRDEKAQRSGGCWQLERYSSL